MSKWYLLDDLEALLKDKLDPADLAQVKSLVENRVDEIESDAYDEGYVNGGENW